MARLFGADAKKCRFAGIRKMSCLSAAKRYFVAADLLAVCFNTWSCLWCGPCATRPASHGVARFSAASTMFVTGKGSGIPSSAYKRTRFWNECSTRHSLT